jgi:hypothetical protein
MDERFSTGGNYVNFLTEDESPERVAAALGPGVNRPAEVKKQWDREPFPGESQHPAGLSRRAKRSE